MTELARWCERYLDHLTAERGLANNSVAAYRRDLARYLDWLAARGVTRSEQVTSADILAHQRELAAGTPERKPLAAASVARAVVSIRNFHGFIADETTTDSPAADVGVPTLGKHLPKALSVDEVQRLLDSIGRDTAEGLRDACLLELLYGTGARISEIVALDVDDVGNRDDPDARLRLFGKGSKERLVPLGSYARDAIDAWLVRGRPAYAAKGGGTPALLLNTRGARLSRQSAWNILQARASDAGLTQQVSPHSLRHSFATHLLDGGADIRVVQELLGHASVTTTQIYTEVTAEHLREVFVTSHPRARS